MNNNRFYTVQEVMSLLKVSDETVYRWIRNGTIKATRIGKHWLIDAEALEKTMEKTSNA